MEPPIQNFDRDTGRPSIGLALGGGAARGWAHIGVLQAFNEAGIKVDVIAGTSIGALVGGAFAAGKLERLETFARSMTTRRLFALADISIFSSGLVGGKRIDRELHELFGDMQLESLDTRTVFIATELSTGHEIWLRRGDLLDLMKASFALPGIFKPVDINGRALVDGALTNPVPVSVCRAYGARLVIAVSLSPENLPHGSTVPDLPDFEEPEQDIFSLTLTGKAKSIKSALKHQLGDGSVKPKGIPAVMMQAFTIIQDRLTRSRLAGDPPDVTIEPYIGDIGLFDFQRAAEGIEAGRRAAGSALNEIHAMVERLSVKPRA